MQSCGGPVIVPGRPYNCASRKNRGSGVAGQSPSLAVQPTEFRREPCLKWFAWTAASGPALRVWIGSTWTSSTEVRRRAAEIASVASTAGMALVDDPTNFDAAANLLQWNGSAWQLVPQRTQSRSLGPHPTTALIASLFATPSVASRRLMINVPLPLSRASGASAHLARAPQRA